MKRSTIKFSSGAKLIALAVVAVMLPTTILSVIQYRSLVELENTTKVAVQENLRQTLQRVTRRVEEQIKATAKETLDSIKLQEIEQASLAEIEQRFATIKQSHPEIDELFLIADYECTDKNFALFYTPAGLRRIEQAQFRDSMEFSKLYNTYKSAYYVQTSMHMKSDLLYWQDSCPFCWEKKAYQLQSYVFRRLVDPTTNKHCGYVGMTLSGDYLVTKFFPQVIPELLGGAGISAKDSDLALIIHDDKKREIYTSQPAPKDPEVWLSFAPVFPKWKLVIGYKNATIESLARDNFQKSVMLSLFVLSLLIIGIILTLRATAREMRLAQAKSTFVSNVSHELKTPLALIRLFAETLELGRVKSPEKAQEYYHIINNESRRLTQLINNILDFSKIEAGRKEYQFAPSNVAEVVQEVIKSYEYQITSAGFELTTDIQRDLPLALIDCDAISQAVLNLLNNAVKYSEETKKIIVRVRARERHILIEVADSGIGIPRSEQEKIFEKFYRVSTGLVHDTKGSGLGLALVKHIVEAHRGQILLESTPGKGSRFTLLLPVQETATAPKGLSFEGGGYKVAESPNN